MSYLLLKNEVVLTKNIMHIEMKENTIEILYSIVVPEQGNKFYGHILDYSEVKNDVNEEKTKIEQDYEKLMQALNVESNYISEKQYNILKNEKNECNFNFLYNQAFLKRIYDIVDEKGVNKIGRIKKVFKEYKF